MSETHTYNQNAESSYFAMCLLMPELLVQNFIHSRSLEITTEDDVKVIANAFQVSDQAALVRLLQIGVIENVMCV